MARKNRTDTMDPETPNIFHITSKCVRGAYLFGEEKRSGRGKRSKKGAGKKSKTAKRGARKGRANRRQAVRRRVEFLASLFAMDIYFKGVMSNHFHLVIGNRPDVVRDWDDREVIRRAIKIFPYKFARMGVKDGEPTEAQTKRFVSDETLVSDMRLRLSDPSWFMKQLKQQIATQANKEDECVGHFFIGRFHHRVITDLTGLFVCGVYVDLQQVAAGEVQTPEESMHTSAGWRILGRSLRIERKHQEAQLVDGFLTPISHLGDGQKYPPAGKADSLRLSDQGRLEVSLDRYLELLDWASRLSRPGKRGKTPSGLPALLDRLDLTADSLKVMLEDYESIFSESVGSIDGMTKLAHERGDRESRDAERLRAHLDAKGINLRLKRHK